jgi:ATP-dependent Clp protease ATP-binding subunit ClpA
MDSFLEKYGEDLTANKYVTNPAIARDKELKELVMVLLTPEKSACLVGKPGIGKTAIVEGLAYHMQMNDMPKALQGYKVYKISTPSLVGTTDGENKVMQLVNELKNRDKIIVFIDEIHMLMGASASNGPMDLANMFKEGLGRGTVKLIGATTTEEYERYVLRDKAFVRRFQRIDVSEPTQEMCVQILMRTVPKIEYQTGVKLNYTDFIKENIMKFIVNMTSEFKRVYEVSSRYPDIALVVLRQAFSNAVYENRSTVCFKNIYDAIRFTKAVYPDVIKKELVVFKEAFKEELAKEGVVVNPDNYLA